MNRAAESRADRDGSEVGCKLGPAVRDDPAPVVAVPAAVDAGPMHGTLMAGLGC